MELQRSYKIGSNRRVPPTTSEKGTRNLKNSEPKGRSPMISINNPSTMRDENQLRQQRARESAERSVDSLNRLTLEQSLARKARCQAQQPELDPNSL